MGHPSSRTSSAIRPDIGPLLSIVIVNYNSWSDVERLVRSLCEAAEVSDGRCEVIVVDNASRGPIPPGLAPPPHGVRLICRAENGGFAVGVNAGWRVARGRWVLLLNPDVIAGADLPGRMLERIGHHAGRPDGAPGIVGFGLRDADGARQPSVGVAPSLSRSLRGLFIPRRRRKYQSVSRLAAGAVPWVTGACALVDRAVLEALGGLDEDFFLYYEEVALCESARRLGRRVEYDPSVEVVHLHPLQNRPITDPLRVITRHSKLLYFRKYLPGWQFVALSWIVAAESAVRIGWASLRGRQVERRTWQAVGRIARRLRRGDEVRGHEVRDLSSGLSAAPQRVGPHGSRARRRARVPGARDA